MKENMKNNWDISFGIYTGICLGIRTYKSKDKTDHVLYLPFMIDIALTIYK